VLNIPTEREWRQVTECGGKRMCSLHVVNHEMGARRRAMEKGFFLFENNWRQGGWGRSCRICDQEKKLLACGSSTIRELNFSRWDVSIVWTCNQGAWSGLVADLDRRKPREEMMGGDCLSVLSGGESGVSSCFLAARSIPSMLSKDWGWDLGCSARKSQNNHGKCMRG